MRAYIEEDQREFINKYKHYDQYNLDRFLKERQKLREKIGTDSIEESIRENIVDSGSLNQIPKMLAQDTSVSMKQIFYPKQSSERDPYSMINLYVQRHAPPAPKTSSAHDRVAKPVVGFA